MAWNLRFLARISLALQSIIMSWLAGRPLQRLFSLPALILAVPLAEAQRHCGDSCRQAPPYLVH